MRIAFLSLIIYALASNLTIAQDEDVSFISKLEVQEGKSYWAGISNLLLVDTLILHDRSSLEFLSGNFTGALEAKVAYIGKNVIISSKSDNKYPGRDGGNLYIRIHFAELGSLTIDTRGADGILSTGTTAGTNDIPPTVEKVVIIDSKGNKSTMDITVPGYPGSLPTPGKTGIEGGKGGNVTLIYSSPGFLPVFNHVNAPHSIQLLVESGAYGPGRFRDKNSIRISKRKTKNPNEETTKDTSKFGTVEIIRVVD